MTAPLEIDHEPTVVLPSGERGLYGVYDLVTSLLDSGHVVCIHDGDATVAPRVHEDTMDVLTSNWQDVEAILAARFIEANRRLEALTGKPDTLAADLRAALLPLVTDSERPAAE